MSVKFTDSIDKIVKIYIRVVTTQSFSYKGEIYDPFHIRISPLIFRSYTCSPNCGACCFCFSLDYLPSEDGIYTASLRKVEVNGKVFGIHSYLQEGKSNFCSYLSNNDGRCTIHSRSPFTCDFELLRFSISKNANRPHTLSTRLYGRGWQMKRITGERGALCTIEDYDPSVIPDIVRRLTRLREWASYFQISTCLSTIINWIETGPHFEPLIIDNRRHKDNGLFGKPDPSRV